MPGIFRNVLFVLYRIAVVILSFCREHKYGAVCVLFLLWVWHGDHAWGCYIADDSHVGIGTMGWYGVCGIQTTSDASFVDNVFLYKPAKESGGFSGYLDAKRMARILRGRVVGRVKYRGEYQIKTRRWKFPYEMKQVCYLYDGLSYVEFQDYRDIWLPTGMTSRPSDGEILSKEKEQRIWGLCNYLVYRDTGGGYDSDCGKRHSEYEDDARTLFESGKDIPIWRPFWVAWSGNLLDRFCRFCLFLRWEF